MINRYVVLVAGLFLAVAPAQAQLMDKLGALGGGGGGGMGLPSVGQASPSNTAGVLQYCVRNNYVNNGSASSVLGRLSGSQQSDSGYRSGQNGVLDTGGGNSFSLGGDGIKQQITQKVCDQILQRAKSLF